MNAVEAAHMVSHTKHASGIMVDYAKDQMDDEDIREFVETLHVAASTLADDAMRNDADKNDPAHLFRKVFMLGWLAAISYGGCMDSHEDAESLIDPVGNLTPGDLN